jgi:hypothetical protein
MAIDDVPKKAFIDAQILLDSRMAEPRSRIAREIEKGYGLKRGTLGDANFIEVRVLSLLYLLILYPKEIWNLKPNSPEFVDLPNVFDIGAIDISWGKRSFPEHDHYEFIHRVRNAVAHAKVSFQGSQIILCDRNGFQAHFDVHKMSQFLTKVGSFLANMSMPPLH